VSKRSDVKAAASDQAYDRIRHDIINGVLKEHERLTEQALAKRLGLSRTPVREAISRLVHEGFIERQGGYSTRVARFSSDETDQIFQLRLLLEGYAARRAATLASAEQIDALRALANQMSACTPPESAEDYDNIARANEAFHRTICEAAKSPRLIALLAVAIEVGLIAKTYRLYSEQALVRSCQHHHELVDAIVARSPEWAESVMASHILAAQATNQAFSADDDQAASHTTDTEDTMDVSSSAHSNTHSSTGG